MFFLNIYLYISLLFIIYTNVYTTKNKTKINKKQVSLILLQSIGPQTKFIFD